MAVTHLTGRLFWNDDSDRARVHAGGRARHRHCAPIWAKPSAAGAPLAEIDSPDFGQALANARTAVGNLAAADKAFARSKELLAHGAAAQKDVEAAEAAYVAALAERDRAEAVLANYGGSDKSTNSIYILRSPMAGSAGGKKHQPRPGTARRSDAGQRAPIFSRPSLSSAIPTKFWLQLDVAESDLASLAGRTASARHCRAFPGQGYLRGD